MTRPDLARAVADVTAALAGDSKDEDHDALLELLEALDECDLVAYRDYSADWLIEDFGGWAGLDRGQVGDEEDVLLYVKEARPADSRPSQVQNVLFAWSDSVANRPED